MDGFPFTTRRTSWLAGLFLAGIAYFVYYVWLFSIFLGSYQGYFEKSSFTYSEENLTYSEENLIYNKENLVIWVQVPQYYFNAGQSSLYVHVINRSDNPLNLLKIHLLLSQPNLETPSLPLPYIPQIDGETIYPDVVEIPFIAPNTTATKRVSFIAQSETIIKGILLQIDNSTPAKFIADSDLSLGKSSFKALQHEILEHLLLPPWSNIFILISVLFSIFLIHSKKESTNEPELFLPTGLNLEWFKVASADFLKSFFVLFSFVIISYIAYQLIDLLDSLDFNKDIFFPLILFILFTGLVIYGMSKRSNKNIVQFIALLGFLIFVIGALLVWLAPNMLLSSDGRILWILLFIEGLGAFILFRSQTFSLQNANSDEKIVAKKGNNAKISDSNIIAEINSRKKNFRDRK